MKHEVGKVLMLTSVASMIDQFNMPNICLMKKMGYEVHVACNFKEGNTCDAVRIHRLCKTLRDMDVVIYQWDCPRNLRPMKMCARAYKQLRSHIEKVSYAWIHCQSPIGGALARIAAHDAKILVIYTAHGFHFYKGAPVKNWILYYPAEKLLAHWTDVLITISKEDYRLAEKRLKAKKICYIPGVGIDIQKFKFYRSNDSCRTLQRNEFCRKYQIPDHARILLSVGELNKGKNHRMVIKALKALPRNDVYYMICGQGGLMVRLQEYADRMGVGARIRMPGYQENMPWIYENADIFVLPSLREGISAALMEAMAAGLPCVVSDIRGNRELMGAKKGDGSWKQGGICFDLKQPAQLSQALETLLADEQLRLKCAAYNQKKIMKYGIGNVQKRMQQIYTGVENLKFKHQRRKRSQHVAVSVLIAVYEPDKSWLEQLLWSVRKQSFQNYEVILMDDASGQTVFEMVCQIVNKIFENKDQVKVLQSDVNEGSNKTFEKLAVLAAGDYLAFCDQDDIWRRDKLQKLMEVIQEEKAVMAYSDMEVIDSTGKLLYAGLRSMRWGLKFVSGEAAAAWYIMENCTAACSMLVQSRIVKKAMPFYKDVCCDQWISVYAAAAGRVAFVDEPLVKYRRHGKNQTAVLKDIYSKEDYVTKRILAAAGFVRELRKRGIHYPYEEEIRAFILARKNKDIPNIWKYRRFSRKYAYFDIFAACMPEAAVRGLIWYMKNMRNHEIRRR